ncbi:hypothetical protein C8R46DRAFT_655551 [Mycena filopes]|nr:hypothetical protein C8R46DRAFT_655551 [Mycena filopes]
MDDQPLFPLDLEREIFETLAILHPGAILTLLHVARRVLVWIEPLLYRVVCVEKDAGNRYRKPVASLLNKPAEFCTLAVRHLAILGPPSGHLSEELLQLLKRCSGVTDLVLACSLQQNPSLPALLAEMPLRRFTVCVAELGCHLTHPLFASLTHLVSVDWVEETFRALAEQIPALLSLTHLAMFFNVSQNIILPILPNCPRLQVFLVLYAHDLMYNAAKRLPRQDPRFVIGVHGDYWTQWEAGAKGLGDHWSRADDFLAQKRRGEIEDGRYWLD